MSKVTPEPTFKRNGLVSVKFNADHVSFMVKLKELNKNGLVDIMLISKLQAYHTKPQSLTAKWKQLLFTKYHTKPNNFDLSLSNYN